ncbi:MAG: tetratricopeptide repeat protein [Calditrichota bacterium]
MNPWQRWSRLIGIVWALVLLTLAVTWPPFGSWTIDDGVKRLAAQEGTGLWAEQIPDGPLRSQLAHPDANVPLHPPFAEREPGSQVLGFSPWTRILFKGIFAGGELLWKLIPAIIAILVWISFEIAGFPFAFLLMPLSFYGLVPWEHGLSWLLLWPAVWLAFAKQNHTSGSMLFGSGLLLAMAAALRPETLLLIPAVAIYYLVSRSRRGALWMMGGTIFGLAALWSWYALTGGQSALIQFSLNLAGSEFTVGAWLRHRLEAIYTLFIRADYKLGLSLIIFVCFTAGGITLIRGEQKKSRLLFVLGLLLLASGTIWFQFRLWRSPVPVLTMMYANSLIVAMPWVLLLMVPPWRWLVAGGFAAALLINVILFTPVWEGVHWGPRVMLFIVPLLIIDLYRSQRARGWAFGVLLVITLIQSVSSAGVAYARARETSDRVVLAREKLGNPVICPTESQCADLAPLWMDREFFRTVNPRELRRLLCEMRLARLDTVWLHVGANDPLFDQAFPDAKPAVPVRITFLQAKAFYTTQWRIYELALTAGDSLWSELFEKSAGEWLAESGTDDALRFQREAVRLMPLTAERHQNLAVILAQLGKTADARIAAETALTLNPNLEEPRRLLNLLETPNSTAP